MNKPKLKLELFETKEEKTLPAKFLSKILGGDTASTTTPSGTNAPYYTISAQTNTEVETSKEN